MSKSRPLPVDHHDLAVDHAPLAAARLEQLDELGEVAGQRASLREPSSTSSPSRNTMQRKPSHLGSNRARRPRDLVHGLGEHRLHRGHHGKVHGPILGRGAADLHWFDLPRPFGKKFPRCGEEVVKAVPRLGGTPSDRDRYMTASVRDAELAARFRQDPEVFTEVHDRYYPASTASRGAARRPGRRGCHGGDVPHRVRPAAEVRRDARRAAAVVVRDRHEPGGGTPPQGSAPLPAADAAGGRARVR